ERRIAPFGCEAVVKPLHAVYLIHRDCRFWGRFATQRGQAPSPQQVCGPQLTGINRARPVFLLDHIKKAPCRLPDKGLFCAKCLSWRFIWI
ncbi:hypothetical protein, partial [Pseudomonas sp. GM50]|uniref:hypothetical protein n=1 Tax=Pseudomonas sp. GM50 TaxID=1144332 RepID=UPI001EE66517